MSNTIEAVVCKVTQNVLMLAEHINRNTVEISELKERLDKKDEQIETLTRICTSLSQNQVLY